MQQAILRLTSYWVEQGCILTQPFNTEVGAGTLNPATFLRVLGPEPWRVAYVEPSVRPDDSRYGDNPNRMQTHTQFQVILKPEPGNPQELYLGSLAALDIDLGRHDVRFVEDNWASPALGAWGLGWEVWLDGLEISQFTYFQQAGGYSLEPVAVELTYGMERILMALQSVRHWKEIEYADGVNYGEIYGQVEYEMSAYYLDAADVDTQRALFDSYEAEARRLLDARLPIPAHYYVLKCSHTFNVLDSRKAIGTTERARAFGRMRGLAHEVAGLWIDRRAELGHPLGAAPPPPEAVVPAKGADAEGPQPLVFEIGTEELPPAEARRAVDSLRIAVPERLAAARLKHGALEVFSTPRRLVLVLEDLTPRQTEMRRLVRGPRVDAAFGGDGEPTPAAIGFARSHGVDVTELSRTTVDGKEFVTVERVDPGQPAVDVLAEALPAVVTGLSAGKNMRWCAPDLSFSRPIRWLLALFGDTVVPFAVAGMASGRTTRVHRAAPEPEVTVAGAGEYRAALEGHGIVIDGAERRRVIVEQAERLAGLVGGRIDAGTEAGLLDEITDLVEQPTAVAGSFDPAYLDLPTEVLTVVMRKHQRYLPIRDDAGGLLPHFVAVANGAIDEDTVRRGNEAVLEARFADAAFFWHHDLGNAPEVMAQGLSSLMFEERLGSMADRVGRIGRTARALADAVGLDAADRAVLDEASALLKFDLASEMVTELSSLAGVMGQIYAERAGRPAAVARALLEAELPRTSGDALPASLPGAVLSLADRLDLIVGLFGVGATPTGSVDPLGLRRAALGAVQVLLADSPVLDVDLPTALTLAASHQPVSVDDDALAEAGQFITRRFEQLLVEAGHHKELVRGVLPLAARPRHALATLADLEDLIDGEDFKRVSESYRRSCRLAGADAGGAPEIDPARFEHGSEGNLLEALRATEQRLAGSDDLRSFVAAFAALVDPITDFFDGVMVMAEDPAVRENRLALLRAVRRLGEGRLDWEALD